MYGVEGLRSQTLGEVHSTKVVYDSWEILMVNMASRDPRLPEVEIFTSKEDALYDEWRRYLDSQQGNSSKGTISMALLTERATSGTEAMLSG